MSKQPRVEPQTLAYAAGQAACLPIPATQPPALTRSQGGQAARPAFFTALIAIVLLFLNVGSASARQKLVLFNWSDYMDPAVLAEFERRFDCQVTMDLYDEAEKMLAKIQAGGVSAYDLVVPPDYLVPTMVKLNLLAPLRKEHLPNFKNLAPRFVSPPYDPGNRHSLPYMWGTMGILIRPEPGRKIVESWGMVFDPKLQPANFVLMDSIRDCIGAALKYQGHSMNTTDLRELKGALDLLTATKAKSKGFATSIAGANQIRARTVSAAVVYAGDATQAIKEDPTLRYLLPREGTEIWVDNFAIPAKAPNRDLAEKFLNFLLEPAIAARLAAYVHYATPNEAAGKLLPPEHFKNPAIHPPTELLPRLEFLRDVGPATRYYDEIWTKVKAR